MSEEDEEQSRQRIAALLKVIEEARRGRPQLVEEVNEAEAKATEFNRYAARQQIEARRSRGTAQLVSGESQAHHKEQARIADEAAAANQTAASRQAQAMLSARRRLGDLDKLIQNSEEMLRELGHTG